MATPATPIADGHDPQPQYADLGRFGEPRLHGDHPHGGEDGAALNGAARLIRERQRGFLAAATIARGKSECIPASLPARGCSRGAPQ
jgi:hypothetical protein